MRIKTFLKLFIFTFLFVALACGIWLFYFQGSVLKLPKLPKDEKILWASDKPAPETIEPGAYLAALNAVFNEDLQKAGSFYLKVLAGDPNNEKLQKEAYFFNAILGNFDEIRPMVDKLSPELRAVFLTDYVKIGYAIKDENWQKVREKMTSHPPLPLDEIVRPLLKAWSYAGEKNYQEAMKALDALKKNKGLEAYYYYHKGLIAMLLEQNFAADESFQKLAENKLFSFSLYPEIRAFYVQQGLWHLNNPFYVQWQLFSAEQPGTAEIIMNAGIKRLSATRGAAEVFYNLSTAMGASKTNYEEALILSSLSLYLNPEQELPKIWNAEILEQVKKPQLAKYYYGLLKDRTTQTMEFKKAMNLLACGQKKEAKPLLLQLQYTNQNSTPLWWALASVYQDEKNWSAAVQAYTRILEIEGESNRKYASDIYFARAFIYGEQNQKAKAEADLEHALELNPENPMLLNHLGYQWLEKDQTLDKGFELVEKAYNLKSSDPHIIDSMAFAYYRRADYRKALPLAEKTVDIMPQSSVANAHLGDIYKALGRYREAVFQYKKALALKYDLTPELKEELLDKITQNEQIFK